MIHRIFDFFSVSSTFVSLMSTKGIIFTRGVKIQPLMLMSEIKIKLTLKTSDFLYICFKTTIFLAVSRKIGCFQRVKWV